MKIDHSDSPPREVVLRGTHAGASQSPKSGKLRLLMKEREDVASRLAELDYLIWALEEIYRREPMKAPPSPSGTPVPRGSLTTERGKPRP